MTGIDLSVQGDPTSCEESAQRLLALRRSLRGLDERLGSGSRMPESEFDGLSADRLRQRCQRSSTTAQRLLGHTDLLATGLSDYAERLREVQSVLKRARRSALDVGLQVHGDLIERPEDLERLQDYRVIAGLVRTARLVQAQAEAGLDATVVAIGDTGLPFALPADVYPPTALPPPGPPPAPPGNASGSDHRQPIPGWPPTESDWPTGPGEPSTPESTTGEGTPTAGRAADPAESAPGPSGSRPAGMLGGEDGDSAVLRPGPAALVPTGLSAAGLLSKGSFEQPGTLDPTGTFHQPGTFEQPGTLDPTGTLEQPGTFEQPGTLDPTGTLEQPGTFEQPGTLRTEESATTTASMVPPGQPIPPGSPGGRNGSPGSPAPGTHRAAQEPG